MPAETVAVAAWVAAVIFAAVVLLFTGYEVACKARRLQRERRRLGSLLGELGRTLQPTDNRCAKLSAADQGSASGGPPETSVRLG